jgi:hypothetical protein
MRVFTTAITGPLVLGDLGNSNDDRPAAPPLLTPERAVCQV